MVKAVESDVFFVTPALGACAFLVGIAFVVCCSKKHQTSSQMFGHVRLDRRPHPKSGVAKDAIVLQFADLYDIQATWSSKSHAASQAFHIHNDDRPAKPKDRNFMSLEMEGPTSQTGQYQHRNVQRNDQTSRIAVPSRAGRQRHGADRTHPVPLLDKEKEALKGAINQREKHLGNHRGNAGHSAEKTLCRLPLDTAEYAQPHRYEGKRSTITLGGPFGPYDVVHPHGADNPADEPFYFVLEEQTKDKNVSPDHPSKQELMLSSPQDTFLGQVARLDGRPRLPAPEEADGSNESIPPRIRMDYEELDDKDVLPKGRGMPSSPDAPMRSAQDDRSRYCYEDPQPSTMHRTDNFPANPSFTPWPGCPSKVLLTHPCRENVIAERKPEMAGSTWSQHTDLPRCSSDGRKKSDFLYSNHKIKKGQHTMYRPVQIVKGNGRRLDRTVLRRSQSEFGIDFSGTEREHFNSNQNIGVSVTEMTRTGEILKTDLYYDHISKNPSTYTANAVGGGVYNRCIPSEDIQVSAGEYSEAMVPKLKPKEWKKHSEAKQHRSNKEEGYKDPFSQELAFYDHLERRNFTATTSGTGPVEYDMADYNFL